MSDFPNFLLFSLLEKVRELLEGVDAAKKSRDSGLAPDTLESLASQVREKLIQIWHCQLHKESKIYAALVLQK